MGVQDRDWWREAYDRARYDPKQFRRKAARPFHEGADAPRSRIILIWILVLAALYAVFDRVERRHAAQPDQRRVASIAPATATSATVPTTPASPASDVSQRITSSSIPQLRAPQPPPPRAAANRASSPIFRCGSTYSDQPCQGYRIVDPPAAEGLRVAPSDRMSRLVAEGRTTSVESSSTVTERSGGRTVTSTTTVDASTKAAACSAVAQQIDSLDKAARQPASAATQDFYRARRRAATNQSAALHC